MIIESLSSSKDKERIARCFVEAVINQEPDLLEGDYKVNKNKLDDYMEALSILADFQRQGQCSFSCDLWYKPYELHCVYVTWNIDKDPNGLPEYSAEKVSELIGKFDSIQLDKQESFTWQLSSCIYYEEG